MPIKWHRTNYYIFNTSLYLSIQNNLYIKTVLMSLKSIKYYFKPKIIYWYPMLPLCDVSQCCNPCIHFIYLYSGPDTEILLLCVMLTTACSCGQTIGHAHLYMSIKWIQCYNIDSHGGNVGYRLNVLSLTEYVYKALEPSQCKCHQWSLRFCHLKHTYKYLE